MAPSRTEPIPCGIANRERPGGCDPQKIVDVLIDDAARAIFFSVDDPATVEQLSEQCAIPSTTAYRKVASLVDAGLIEPIEQRSSSPATAYVKATERVSIIYDEPIQIRCVKTGLQLYCEPFEE